jgi:hypothetical protein
MLRSRAATVRTVVIAIALGAAASAVPAQAATTFQVSPSGSGTACSEAAPCNIYYALATSVAGDTVVLAGDEGSYGSPDTPLTATLKVKNGVAMEGAAGGPRARIFSSVSEATGSIELGNGGTAQRLSRVEVENAASFGTALLAAGLADHVITNSPNGGAGCITRPGTTITNSVCSGAYGVYEAVGGGGAWPLTLRNDTIYGTQEGMLLGSGGPELQVNAVNTIVRGVGFADIHAYQSGSGSVTATLGHSNYSDVNVEAGAAVSSPGVSTNQTAAPHFVDAESGDFHQASDSPTIDAGVNDAANEATDLDGNTRSLPRIVGCEGGNNALTDIGAFELVPAVPDCVKPGPPTAPETKITKAKVRGRSAKFRFSAPGVADPSFECRLDKKPFRRCESPRRYRRLKPGKHVFRVRAVAADGLRDPTPALRRFRIAGS